jgi:hypothetical protein
MVKKCKSPYAASHVDYHDEQSSDEDKGPHVTASIKLKQDVDPVAKRIKTKNNKHNCKMRGRANIITQYLDTRMISNKKIKKEIYYKDSEGIDMTYPKGSKVKDSINLKILTNNDDINNFNVVVGHIQILILPDYRNRFLNIVDPCCFPSHPQ